MGCLFHPNGEYYVPESRWMQEKYFMFLWNPSIRKYKRVDHPLQVPSRDRYKTMSMLMGFGYASNDRDHKIIVITTDEYNKDRVFLYSLRKSSWTEIRLRAKLKYWGCLVTEDDSGTYFNGAFHQVAYTSEKSKAVIHWSDNYRIMVCFHVDRQELYYFDLIPTQMQPYKGQGRRYQPLVYKNMLAICDIMGNTSSWTFLFEVQTQKGWLFRQLLYGAYYDEDDDNEDSSLPVKLVSAIASLLRSFFPLLVTFIAAQIVIFLIFALFGVFGYLGVKGIEVIEGEFSYNSPYFYGISLIGAVLLGLVLVYVGVNWILVNVVVVVESKWGFQPMARSKDLVRGMRWVALSLIVFFGFFELVLLWISLVSGGDSIAVEDGWNTWAFAVRIMATTAVLTVLLLHGIAAATVLYIYCKALHGELAREIAHEFAADYVSLPFDDQKVPHIVCYVH
uniref:F-box associated beta-propeller type 1 domain-containing protein n=1 Tax=Chenopodium quinoa TaxID=63459 RepID=A0A803L1W7_CHEQI